MTILGPFGGSWEPWHHVPWKRDTWMPAMTWAPNSCSPAATGCGQVWEAECWQTRQAGMLPLPAQRLWRGMTASAGLISAFPEQPSYWNCIPLSGNRGSCWEDGLKVRQHQAPADAELLAIPQPGACSFLSVQPCASCSALINLRDPGPRVSLLPAQGPLLPCRVRLRDPSMG